MLFVVHHIALDFWAFDLLFDELELFYREETTGAGRTCRRPRRPITTSFVGRSRNLAAPEGERLWEYWQRQLEWRVAAPRSAHGLSATASAVVSREVLFV